VKSVLREFSSGKGTQILGPVFVGGYGGPSSASEYMYVLQSRTEFAKRLRGGQTLFLRFGDVIMFAQP